MIESIFFCVVLYTNTESGDRRRRSLRGLVFPSTFRRLRGSAAVHFHQSMCVCVCAQTNTHTHARLDRWPCQLPCHCWGCGGAAGPAGSSPAPSSSSKLSLLFLLNSFCPPPRHRCCSSSYVYSSFQLYENIRGSLLD